MKDLDYGGLFNNQVMEARPFSAAGALITLQEMTVAPCTSMAFSWSSCQVENRDLDVYNGMKTFAIINSTSELAVINYL